MIQNVQEGRHARPSWTYFAASAATLAVMVLAVVLREGDGPRFPGAPLLTFTLLGWIPINFRSRWPVPVLAATVAVSLLQLLTLPVLDPNWEPPIDIAAFQPIPIATVVAAYAVAVRPRGRRWAPGIAASAVLPLISLTVSSDDHLWTAIVMSNLILDGTAAGVLVAGRRDRRVREDQARRDLTRREVEAERLRIARELHDVVAHHLTLINAQAGVADYLIRADPDAAATALHGMARHTRQALDELRATVGLLRRAEVGEEVNTAAEPSPPEAVPLMPLPTVARVPELLETVRGAGLAVELHTFGQAAQLAPGADLAAYRVVQEALTNAAKHAPDAPITVTLSWLERRLRIRVTNPIASARVRDGSGSGHGLLGMTERVRAAGGSIREDGPGSDRTEFVIDVELPTEPAGIAPQSGPHPVTPPTTSAGPE